MKKENKKHYALFDKHLNQITSIGFNKTTKKAVKKSLIDYLLLGNFSEEGEESINKNTLSELLNNFEFELRSSSMMSSNHKMISKY